MSDGLLQKFITLERKYIYLVVLIVAAIPTVKPLGIPIVISEETRIFYQEIEKLEPGDVIFLWITTDAGDYPEIGQTSESILQELFARDVKVLMASGRMATSMLFLPNLERISDKFGKVNGVDWMYYGYIPGEEVAMASLAADFHSIPVDVYGTPIEQLSILNNLNTISDVQLFIGALESPDDLAAVVRQIHVTYGAKCLVTVTQKCLSAATPYLGAGQIAGILKGVRGGAEFEQITHRPGLLSQQIDVQVLVQGSVLILGFSYMISDAIIRLKQKKEVEK